MQFRTLGVLDSKEPLRLEFASSEAPRQWLSSQPRKAGATPRLKARMGCLGYTPVATLPQDISPKRSTAWSPRSPWTTWTPAESAEARGRDGLVLAQHLRSLAEGHRTEFSASTRPCWPGCYENWQRKVHELMRRSARGVADITGAALFLFNGHPLARYEPSSGFVGEAQRA